jgi:hypothetical protein
MLSLQVPSRMRDFPLTDRIDCYCIPEIVYFFFHRDISINSLVGKIPSAIFTISKLVHLYEQKIIEDNRDNLTFDLFLNLIVFVKRSLNELFEFASAH